MDDESLDTNLRNIINVLQQSEKRSQQQIKKLEEMTLDVPFFKQYRLDGKEFIHKRCCALMGYEYFKQGEAIFHIDTSGDKFYIILKGTVGVYIKIERSDEQNNQGGGKDKNNSNANNKDNKQPAEKNVELTCVKELGDGLSFGELSLLQNKKRLASIICHSNCHIATLNKAQFVQVLGESEEQKILKEMQFFADLPFFEGWNFNLLKLLYLNSYVKTYTKGQFVFQENADSNAVYFIKSGEFELEKHFQYTNVISAGEYYPFDEAQNARAESSFQQFDQVLSGKNKNHKKKAGENSPRSNNQPGPAHGKNNDPLGKLIKLCIYTDKEMFGEEDILKGQRRSFSVKCISFTGQLIMIKLRDFQHRILNDIRTKHLIYQRLQNKNEMMDRKIQLIEKSMYNYTDYYFPKSSVITSLNASHIPLFRKSKQNSKLANHDRTFFYLENNQQPPAPSPLAPPQIVTVSNKKGVDNMSHSSQREDRYESSNLIPAPNQKSSSLIKSSTNIQPLNIFERKFMKSQTQLCQSKTLAPQVKATEILEEIPSYPTSQTAIPNPKSRNKQPSISLSQSNIQNIFHNINKNNEFIYTSQNSHDPYQHHGDLAESPEMSSPLKMKRSLVFKQSSRDLAKSTLPSSESPNLLHINIKSNESHDLELLGSTTSRQFQLDESEGPLHRIDQFNLDLTDRILTPHHQQSEQMNENSRNSKSFRLKSQMSNNSAQNQTGSSHNIESPLLNRSHSLKKSSKDEQFQRNELTEGFYRNLRINFFSKFKSQNIQSLKKHIQSSLIDSMPDSFQPLERSDLKLYNKKRKGNIQAEKDQFIKWFNHEMFESRMHQKPAGEKKSQNQTMQANSSFQETTEQKNQGNSGEEQSSNRIHHSEQPTLRYKQRAKLNKNFNLDTEAITTNMPCKSCKSEFTSPTRKSQLNKLIRPISSSTRKKSHQNLEKSYEDDEEDNRQEVELNRYQSLQNKERVTQTDLLSPEKKQGLNKVKSIQNLYEQHRSKYELGSTQNLKLSQQMSTTHSDRNTFFNTFSDKIESPIKLDQQHSNSIKPDCPSDFMPIFSPQTKFEELKHLKKPRLLGGWQQFLQQNSPTTSYLSANTPVDSQKSIKLPASLAPKSEKNILNSLLDVKIPKKFSSNKYSKQSNFTQFMDSSIVSPVATFKESSKNNTSLESSNFKFFKKSTDRKVISKFEQQLYNINNNKSNHAL